MKKYRDIETALLESGDLVSHGITALINNMGKTVAIITAAITCLVTFTEIRFAELSGAGFVPSLILLLTSAYIIYFSLEDAGEKHGEKTEEFESARARYLEARERILGEDIDELREYCHRYAEAELLFRKRSALLFHGLSEKDLSEYLENKKNGRGKNARVLKRIASMRAASISPGLLLSGEGRIKRAELESPERRKIRSLLLKLIPSTVCMTVTVSVILGARPGLTPTEIINALLKLSSLPLIGFRGYSAGYLYTKRELSAWLDTKSGILEGFHASRTASGERSLA